MERQARTRRLVSYGSSPTPTRNVHDLGSGYAGLRRGRREALKLAGAVLLGLLLTTGVGELSYQQGIAAGRSQANQARQQFLQERMGGAVPALVQSGSSGNQTSQAGAPAGTSPRPGTGAGAWQGVMGTIGKVDGSALIVTLDDGTTVTFALNDTTTVNITGEGSRADLKEGQTVVVAGERSEDGKYTARSVQVMTVER